MSCGHVLNGKDRWSLTCDQVLNLEGSLVTDLEATYLMGSGSWSLTFGHILKREGPSVTNLWPRTETGRFVGH